MRTKLTNLHILPTSDHSEWLKSKNVKVNLMMIFVWPCHTALLSWASVEWFPEQQGRLTRMQYIIKFFTGDSS